MPVNRVWRNSDYWRQVPLYRLASLLLGFFCLFGMLGCLIDVIELGRKPLIEVVVWTMFTGAMAVGYLLVLFRAPRWVVVVLAVHVLGSHPVGRIIRSLTGTSPYLATSESLRFAGVFSLLLSLLAAFFFLRFFNNEGRNAVRMQTELALAHAIQHTLVPVINIKHAALEIYGISLPSEKVGGDLVDAVALADGSVVAYVADIAGHGLPAGILMGMFKTAVRTLLFDSPSPTTLLERLNRVLPEVKEPEAYATAVVLRIPPRGDSSWYVEYAIAGHPPLLHASASAPSVQRLADSQFPVGLLPDPDYRVHRVEMLSGDVLLIATDGIIEAFDKSGNDFGMANLEGVLLKNMSRPLAEIAQEINRAVQNGYAQADDQSLLLVRAV